jgi:arsenate reductase
MVKNTEASIPVIYHNPACGTSRSVLASLQAAGLEPRVVEYLVHPPDRETLKSLLKLMGRNVREILRKRGTPYEELGLDRADLDDDAIFDAVAAHPILIERPIVVVGENAAVCRPAELVNELIAAAGKSS